MKTKEELNVLKEEVETLNKKLAELTEEELTLVIGGAGQARDIDIHLTPTTDQHTYEKGTLEIPINTLR